MEFEFSENLRRLLISKTKVSGIHRVKGNHAILESKCMLWLLNGLEFSDHLQVWCSPVIEDSIGFFKIKIDWKLALKMREMFGKL